MISKIKEGDYLIAIDECKMIGTYEKTLTIGKKYKIVSMVEKIVPESSDFGVIDDKGTYHTFKHDGMFFIDERILLKKKLKKVKNV